MDRNELRRIRLKADHLQLIGRELLHMSKKTVMDNCNGIGPEFFPGKIRNLINKYNPTFRCSAAIHDMMFAVGYDFSRANDILYINGKWEAEARYSWFNPVRYLAIFRAWRFSRLCQKYGYLAWKKAQQRFK